MIRKMLLSLCLPLALGMTGCVLGALHSSVNGPAVPKAFVVDKATNEAVLADIKNFQACTSRTAPKCDRAERDRIIYTLKLIVDGNYEVYARNFEQVADTSSFLGEVSAATLSGIAPIVGDVGTKDILALASTLTQATSVSMQKNFYQKQSSYAILVVMDAQRLQKWSQVYDRMDKLDVDGYSLAAALTDLAEYRTEGTAVKALTSIQQKAGQTENSAHGDIKKTDQHKLGIRQQVPPPEEAPHN